MRMSLPAMNLVGFFPASFLLVVSLLPKIYYPLHQVVSLDYVSTGVLLLLLFPCVGHA
jgi:hypothetical protein